MTHAIVPGSAGSGFYVVSDAGPSKEESAAALLLLVLAFWCIFYSMWVINGWLDSINQWLRNNINSKTENNNGNTSILTVDVLGEQTFESADNEDDSSSDYTDSTDTSEVRSCNTGQYFGTDKTHQEVVLKMTVPSGIEVMKLEVTARRELTTEEDGMVNHGTTVTDEIDVS